MPTPSFVGDLEVTSSLKLKPGALLYLNDALVNATAAELNSTDLSAVGAMVKIKQLPITADFDNTEQSTDWRLPTKCMVLDVFVDVTTGDTGETLDVGTDGSGSNDPDGFIDGISIATTGIKRGAATVTAGGTETYFASTTRGALLATLVAGANVAGDVGTYYEFPNVTSGGELITYTGSHATANTMRGAIYIVYIELNA